MRHLRRGFVLVAACIGIPGCADDVGIYVANPCGVPLEVLVVNRVVNEPDDSPDVDRAEAEVGAGEVEKVATFSGGEHRTVFVLAAGIRFSFTDGELSDGNGTVVLPVEACIDR